MDQILVPNVPDLLVMPAMRRILAAGDVDACRGAIGDAVTDLQAASGCFIRACEISLSLAGKPAIVWGAGDVDAIPFESGSAFDAWFDRARRRPAELVPFYGEVCGVVGAAQMDAFPLFVGIIADGMPQATPGLEAAMADIAGLAALQLHRLRRDAESRMSRARLDRIGRLQAELLRANVDLLWEADASGLVHVVQALNGRQDLIRVIEGRRLEDLRVAGGRSLRDLAGQGAAMRALRLEHPAQEALYISLGLGEGGNSPACGTLSAGPDMTADRLAADVSLLENLLTARTREENARREAESMLLGLRVLLAPTAFREKLDGLAQHLAQGADCDMVQIVQMRPGEAPRLLSPPRLLSSNGAQALSRVLALGEGHPVTVLPATGDDSAVIRETLGTQSGDIALVTLPYAAERFHLICRGRPDFGLRQRGLAERFSLLLQQALALHEDQDRMVHAAKLSALGQMSTSIAHELRQPLNTISIATQNIAIMLERDAITPALLQEKVDRILQQIDRACRVMDRMRRFGRKSSNDYKPLPLLEVARSARSLMHAVMEQAGIRLAVDISEDIQVLAEELELEQVLVNLLQNARDAIMESHNDMPRVISLKAGFDTADPEQVRLDVQDSGPGFAPHVISHALDAFFTTKSGDKGTGLGLSISHAILREHGGRLQIANAPDGGGLISLFLRRPKAAQSQVVSLGDRR